MSNATMNLLHWMGVYMDQGKCCEGIVPKQRSLSWVCW